MIRRSAVIATSALVLSLGVHFLAIRLTFRVQPDQTRDVATTDVVAMGNAFEDNAETVSTPVEPEPAAVPEPPEETAPEPEPERAEIPSSQVLVASENPQNVVSPDTGTASAVQPTATGPSAPEQGDIPESTTLEPSSGQDEEIADARATPPEGPDTVTEATKGTVDGGTAPAEAETAEAVPQQLAALPAPPATVPPVTSAPSAVPPPPEDLESTEPEIAAAPAQTDPELSDPAVAAGEQVLTSSLRPRLRTPRATPDPAGLPDGASTPRDTRLAPSELIESPLAAYQRDGTNVFAGGRGGARSGVMGFLNSRGPGNSDVTNYAGQILVHLNRATPIAVSARGWARVFFEINPDGTLAWVDVIDGTGSQEVDRAAKEQVRTAAPFPRPPEGKSRKLNFVYRIQ